MTNDIRGHTGDVPRELNPRTYSYAAYRLFTYWVHDKLGKGVRKVILCCSQNPMFPDSEGVYKGLKFADDGEEIEVGEVELI
ncbi:hypothetical protein HOLleu_10277 [Holothuria leucospilota]|uniref:Uncharacterized protein n=1 Tax=Holothuria leucospilota TaxID=206669 RepID=A0A9Q1HFL9_HOLLE|nr:hypothetical protein HOLleu_10277 [Holothuria leucospilota]